MTPSEIRAEIERLRDEQLFKATPNTSGIGPIRTTSHDACKHAANILQSILDKIDSNNLNTEI